MEILKYPRTTHVQGSRLQAGDEDLAQVPLRELEGKHLVIEEKQDGANSGISFDADGGLPLQSRGHFLAGGSELRRRYTVPVVAYAPSRPLDAIPLCSRRRPSQP